jgi:5'-3' exonuclease
MIAAIIDGNYLLHRCMRVGSVAALTNRHGKPTGGFFASVRSIHAALYTHRVDSAYIVFDSGISKRRREIYPPYKGARYRDKDDPFYEEKTEEDVEYLRKFRLQRAMLQYILPKLGMRVIRLKDGPSGRWEADDLIHALTYLIPSNRIIVISDDKDMYQLVIQTSEGYVHNVRPIAQKVITEGNFEATVGFPQEQDLLRKAILGDKSDNIANVERVGQKTVDSIFEDGAPVEPYPFEDFFIWCSLHKSKTVNRIANAMDVVLTNYELVDLTFEDIKPATPELREIIFQPVDTEIVTVKRFFTELDLLSIVRELHTWIVPFQRLK